MIESVKSKTILLIRITFINAEVKSMIKGKFVYVKNRRSALFSLVFGTVVTAVDAFSIDKAFIL